MNAPQSARRSEIYDLGYRNYNGPRLGRRYAVRSLGALSLRNTFGLGRKPISKVIAWVLVAAALVPAVIQVAIGALVPLDEGEVFEFWTPEGYYGSIQTIVVLFVAAMASELVGNDRKNNTLPLYFSRPIERSDYVLAKFGALTLGLQMLTLFPELVLFFGTWAGSPDSSTWISDNVSDLPAIVVSAILVSAEFAAIGILIASYASKRAFALVSILGGMLLSMIASASVANLVAEPVGAAVMLLSPIYVARGATLVLFGAMPHVTDIDQAEGIGDQIAAVGLPGIAWIAACLAHIVIAVGLAIRRYRDAI